MELEQGRRRPLFAIADSCRLPLSNKRRLMRCEIKDTTAAAAVADQPRGV